MNFGLQGKRILLTQADEFMGPAISKMLQAQGAVVLEHFGAITSPEAPKNVIAECGNIDILIANLALPAPSTRVQEVEDDEWKTVFDALVQPLPRLVRAVLPQMMERRSGKIIVIGSASALRGINRASTYSAARGAQLLCRLLVSNSPHTISKQMQSHKTLLITQHTFPRKYKQIYAFRSASSVKFLSDGWWQQRKTLLWLLTYVLMPQTVLSGRCFQFQAVG